MFPQLANSQQALQIKADFGFAGRTFAVVKDLGVCRKQLSVGVLKIEQHVFGSYQKHAIAVLNEEAGALRLTGSNQDGA
jgi:hypothetical protein